MEGSSEKQQTVTLSERDWQSFYATCRNLLAHSAEEVSPEEQAVFENIGGQLGMDARIGAPGEGAKVS
jgi:hypothetical protein